MSRLEIGYVAAWATLTTTVILWVFPGSHPIWFTAAVAGVAYGWWKDRRQPPNE